MGEQEWIIAEDMFPTQVHPGRRRGGYWVRQASLPEGKLGDVVIEPDWSKALLSLPSLKQFTRKIPVVGVAFSDEWRMISQDAPLHSDTFNQDLLVIYNIISLMHHIPEGHAYPKLEEFLGFLQERLPDNMHTIHVLSTSLNEPKNSLGRLFVAGLRDAFSLPEEYHDAIRLTLANMGNLSDFTVRKWQERAFQMGEQFFGYAWKNFLPKSSLE